jgi:AraC-like DNA-binding protein
MADITQIRDEPWLTRPLSVGGTTITAAGQVRNVAGIAPSAMRVMGSFGLIYMAEVDGYYVDELGPPRDLVSGDVVWIQPGIAHAYGPREGREWTQVYFILDGSQWERWAQEGILDPQRPVTHAEPVDYWRRRLHEALPADAAHTAAAALRALGATTQTMLELLAAHEESAGVAHENWLLEGQRLLGGRLAERTMTPQAVAREVGLSYENFRKKFAERVGESPGHYQKRRRIEHACAAIYQGTHSFKALADDLGFCDVFHFSKTFRQIVGETPSQFRRKARGL